jgi:Uma2 family endonuclease
MTQFQHRSPQGNLPLSPRLTMPTMYDLPSEDPEDPGLPDEFHDLQPQLLSRTLQLVDYTAAERFTGTDLNLYYDSRHLSWYKRPDWFLALGVSRLYDGEDLRASYVMWQEGVSPSIVIEFLSPGTEQEDLGENSPEDLEPPAQSPDDEQLTENGAASNDQKIREKPPRKWDVYERILRVPYYFVFSRYTNRLRFFQLVGDCYEEQSVDSENPRVWFPGLKIGLGIWRGTFEGVSRNWLRWYDDQDNWILTDTELAQRQAQLEQERAEAERERAEAERERAQAEAERANQAEAQLRDVALNLIQSGMSIAQTTQLTGLTEAQIQDLTNPQT